MEQPRTPLVLDGLGLSERGGSSSHRDYFSSASVTSWKSALMSFSNPKFREDDYLGGEEEQENFDTAGPAG